MGGTRLNQPVIGMVAFGVGYLMVASDGGIFNFSDKPFLGSLGANPPARTDRLGRRGTSDPDPTFLRPGPRRRQGLGRWPGSER